MASILQSSAAPAQGPAQVLHPGDVALAHRGERLETLLGSCVAIILTDPRRTVGAMCHIVHSGFPAKAGASTSHAEPALEAMFDLLRCTGINPLMCEAYLYGGGNMFPALFRETHVGENNAHWAFEMLSALGIPLIERNVGGTTYRRLRWTVGHSAPSVQTIEV